MQLVSFDAPEVGEHGAAHRTGLAALKGPETRIFIHLTILQLLINLNTGYWGFGVWQFRRFTQLIVKIYND